jgi:hypothetical protein
MLSPYIIIFVTPPTSPFNYANVFLTSSEDWSPNQTHTLVYTALYGKFHTTHTGMEQGKLGKSPSDVHIN